MEIAAFATLGVIGLAVAVTNMVARKLALPPVLFYLLLGAVLGPSALGVVDRHALGELFPVALEVLVALIVFEGAFSIDVGQLRRIGQVVRNLLTIGLTVSFVSGTLLAGALDVLPWRTALLFGALVTVTGPTVIGPLVRNVRLNDRVRALLLGEGVLIDPLGAILAVVVLEFVQSGLHTAPLLWLPSRLLAGAAFGLLGAGAVRLVLRVNPRHPAADTTLLLIGMSVGTLAVAERLVPDSGLTAMVVLGVALAMMPVPNREVVRGFEDDLSRALLAAVYILAAATVDLALLPGLWPRGVLVVLGLMLVARPLAVALCALGSDVTRPERLYVGLVGPRGVVAAALAAFVGEELGPERGGPELTALVFLTVLVTIGVQSTYAGALATLLKVRAMRTVIAGAGSVARGLARELGTDGHDVELIEPDPEAIERAEREGLRVRAGDASDARLLAELRAGEAQVAIGATSSDQVNLLFCQYVRAANPEAEVFARVHQPGAIGAFEEAGIHALGETQALTHALLELIGSPVLFEALNPRDQRLVTTELLIGTGLAGRRVRDLQLPQGALVVLLRREGEAQVPHGETRLERHDRLLIFGVPEAVRGARRDLLAVE